MYRQGKIGFRTFWATTPSRCLCVILSECTQSSIPHHREPTGIRGMEKVDALTSGWRPLELRQAWAPGDKFPSWSTAVLGLDSWGWDLNKEILPGSRRSRLDRRLKFPPLSYYIDVWGGVGGRGEGWWRLSNMVEWATIARPTRDNTNLGLNKRSPNQTNRSTTVVWAPCVLTSKG